MLISFRAMEAINSGGFRRENLRLPLFPNTTELVMGASQQTLLASLLPALNRYECLIFRAERPRRSPWVRAFCDLYHPAGPWGSNKFRKAPDITSQKKYRFKSYTVPKIYESLKIWMEQNPTAVGVTGRNSTADHVHHDLFRALDHYFSKEGYYKAFLKACQPIALEQANLPHAERAPLPELVQGTALMPAAATGLEVADSMGDDEDGKATNTPESEGGEGNDHHQEPPAVVSPPSTRHTVASVDLSSSPGENHTTKVANKRYGGKKRKAVASVQISPRYPRRHHASRPKQGLDDVQGNKSCPERLNARQHRLDTDEESNDSTKIATNLEEEETPYQEQKMPASSQEGASIEDNRKEDANPDNDEKQLQQQNLQKKRVHLSKLLQARQKSSTTGNDPLSTKIQGQIDRIDEQVFQLIMQADDTMESLGVAHL